MTYAYDPFGRRVKKDVAGALTYYVYSDEGLIGEYDASGNLLNGYGWRPGSVWSTSPVYMAEGGSYFYYHNDHLGTPQKLTDSVGNTVWSAKYTAFGEAVVDAASSKENNLRFPGQYYDSETGLHYNWNRYYDPATGRYTQTDPIGFAAGDANLYRYVGGNGVNSTDPDGLIIVKWDSSVTPAEHRDFYKGWRKLVSDVGNSPAIQRYFRDYFGVNILDELKLGQGPIVNLAGSPPRRGVVGSFKSGEDHWIWPDEDDTVCIYDTTLRFGVLGVPSASGPPREQFIASVLLHEMAHWANWDAGDGEFKDPPGITPRTSRLIRASQNPIAELQKFVGGGEIWGAEGYLAELILYGTIY